MVSHSRSQKHIDCRRYHVIGNGMRVVDMRIFKNPSKDIRSKAALEIQLRFEYMHKYNLNLDAGHEEWMGRLGEIAEPVDMNLDTYAKCLKAKIYNPKSSGSSGTMSSHNDRHSSMGSRGSSRGSNNKRDRIEERSGEWMSSREWERSQKQMRSRW